MILPANTPINGNVVNGTLQDGLLAINDSLTAHTASIGALQNNIFALAAKAKTVDNRLSNLEASQASAAAQLDQTTQLAQQANTGVASLTKRLEDFISGFLHNSPTSVVSPIASQSATVASPSATLATPVSANTPVFDGSIASSSGQLGLDQLDIITATVAGKLNVLGRTTLNDLAVTGTISTGVLTINGLNNDATASINTFNGDLKLQDQGFGGIDILAGKIKIDTNGNLTSLGTITSKVINTEKLNIITPDTVANPSAVLSSSTGNAMVVKGTDTITIYTTAVTKNSLINITFEGDYSPAVRYWVDSKSASKSFTIKLDAPIARDAKFSWWIVN